jgi:MFS family permease
MLWLGQLGQASAMWAEQVARNWLTWQLTESATALGLVNVARALPLIVLGLFGGVIADRFDKRRTLIVIQLWSLSIYVAMAVLILGGWVELWHVYLTAFLLGGGMALNQPVRTSFIPQLLPGDLLLNALSLNSIAINVTRLVGPAAIGFLIAAFNDNVGPSYVVASAVYVLVIVSTVMIRAPGVQREGGPASIRSDLVEGFRYMLLENRTVLALIVVAMGPLAFGFSYITLLPVFVTEVLNMGPAGFGTIQSVAAVGALIGGFTLASMGQVKRKGQTMLVAGLAYGVVLILFSVVTTPILAFMAVPIIGAAQTVFRTSNNSALLEITPGRLRGRVMSMTFLDTGVQSLAAIMAGTITDTWNVAVGIVLLGAVCTVIVGAIGTAVPSVRRL